MSNNEDKAIVCNPYEPFVDVVAGVKESKAWFNLFCIYRNDITLSYVDLSKRSDCRYTLNTIKKKALLFKWIDRRDMYYTDLRIKNDERLEHLRTYALDKIYKDIDNRSRGANILFKYLMVMAKRNPEWITKYINSFKQLSDSDVNYFKTTLRLLGLPETIKEDNINLNNNVELEDLQDLIQTPEFIDENMKPFELFKEKQDKQKHEVDKNNSKD